MPRCSQSYLEAAQYNEKGGLQFIIKHAYPQNSEILALKSRVS